MLRTSRRDDRYRIQTHALGDSAVSLDIYSSHVGSLRDVVHTYLELIQKSQISDPRSCINSEPPFHGRVHHWATRQQRQDHFLSDGRFGSQAENNQSDPDARQEKAGQQTYDKTFIEYERIAVV